MKKFGFDLILLGQPTSGKDTQALLLAKKYKVQLVRSGDYLRKHWAKKYVQGAPAPSNLIKLLLDESFKKSKSGTDLVFVGAARLLPEAKYLVAQLKKRKRDYFVIYIDLPREEIIKRSVSRGQRLEDKDPKLIKARIAYFKKLVSKTEAYYKKLHKIKYINGKQPISKVTKDIEKLIHDHQRSQTN